MIFGCRTNLRFSSFSNMAYYSPALLPLRIQRHSQKPGCKEQKVVQLYLLQFMTSEEPKNCIRKKSSGEVASQTKLTVFSNQNHYNHRSLYQIIRVMLTISDNHSYLWELHCNANISTEKTILFSIHPQQNTSI